MLRTKQLNYLNIYGNKIFTQLMQLLHTGTAVSQSSILGCLIWHTDGSSVLNTVLRDVATFRLGILLSWNQNTDFRAAIL